MGVTTTHDIEVRGTRFIMELFLDDEGDSRVYLTEACDDTPCYRFKNSATTPSWCCSTHRYDGTGDLPVSLEAPEWCDFSGRDDDGECIQDHQTYDFKEA